MRWSTWSFIQSCIACRSCACSPLWEERVQSAMRRRRMTSRTTTLRQAWLLILAPIAAEYRWYTRNVWCNSESIKVFRTLFGSLCTSICFLWRTDCKVGLYTVYTRMDIFMHAYIHTQVTDNFTRIYKNSHLHACMHTCMHRRLIFLLHLQHWLGGFHAYIHMFTHTYTPKNMHVTDLLTSFRAIHRWLIFWLRSEQYTGSTPTRTCSHTHIPYTGDWPFCFIWRVDWGVSVTSPGWQQQRMWIYQVQQ